MHLTSNEIKNVEIGNVYQVNKSLTSLGYNAMVLTFQKIVRLTP